MATENQDFKALLTKWKLKKYIKTFEEEEWDDVSGWGDLIKDNGQPLIDNDLMNKKGAINKFIRGYKEEFESKLCFLKSSWEFLLSQSLRFYYCFFFLSVVYDSFILVCLCIQK